MANVKWSDLFVGDFFTPNIHMGEDTLLYQKVNNSDSSKTSAIQKALAGVISKSNLS